MLCTLHHAVQVLPRDIRVLGWTDVPEDFSARCSGALCAHETMYAVGGRLHGAGSCVLGAPCLHAQATTPQPLVYC